MGLFKHLLFWPVTGPLFLAEFSLGKVDGVVRDELTDDTRIKAELMELQLQLELGDIDDAGYVAREAELMQQLRDVRNWREEFGMGVSGGVVRVQPAPPGQAGPAHEPGGATAGDAAPVPPDAARPGDAAGGSAADAPGDAPGGPPRSAADAATRDPSGDGADVPAEPDTRGPSVADPRGGADIKINLDWD
jgi:hypothetical protein